jgi:hypothetical protein
MKAVDPHRDRLEPFFDVVPLAIFEPTAQIMSEEGSQVPASIDEKLGVGDVVFLRESMQKRRRGIGPAAADNVDIEQQLRVGVDRRKQPLLLAVDFDLPLVDGNPRRRRRRRIAL